MYLFREGRKHYLDFLRNLTPQALLVFIGAVFIHGGLHGRQPTPEKIAVGVVLWGMAAFAVWCNVSFFFSRLRKATSKPKRSERRRLSLISKASTTARLKQSVKRWWHLTPLVVELVVVMVIIEAACIVAAIAGGFSAVNALKLG